MPQESAKQQYDIAARTLSVGQRVMCNGFPGTVVRLIPNSGMVDVRVPGGMTCVDALDVLRFTPPNFGPEVGTDR